MTTTAQSSPSESPATPTDGQAAPFQTSQVLTVAGGHFMHDTFSAFLPPLLPLIQERLATSYTLTGGLVIFTQLPSLLNPFIGYLADRVSLRYFIILAPGITATLLSSMGFTSTYFTLAMLLLVAGISIAAFHAPAPAMIARVAGNRVGTGMSLFMASGELGRTIGPLVAVAGVTWWGLEGIWRFAAIGWLVSAVLYFRLRHVAARPTGRNDSLAQMWPQARRVFPIITWIMLPKALLAVSLTTYLPIFMRDELQSSLWLAAASLTILEAAGVAGALMTGTISDRIGRSRMLLFLLTLGPLLLALFLWGPTWLTLPVLVGLGLTVISPTPVMLAVVQDQFPNNRAVANGIFMLINFLVRAVCIWGVGWMADQYGLTNAFFWSGVAAVASIPAVFWLPQGNAVQV